MENYAPMAVPQPKMDPTDLIHMVIWKTYFSGIVTGELSGFTSMMSAI